MCGAQQWHRHSESAQCVSVVVHLYELTCGNESAQSVKQKVQDWNKVWKKLDITVSSASLAVFLFFYLIQHCIQWHLVNLETQDSSDQVFDGYFG